jgi:hypothetical protein
VSLRWFVREVLPGTALLAVLLPVAVIAAAALP